MADFDNKLNLNGVSEFKFVISTQKYPYLPNFSFIGPNYDEMPKFGHRPVKNLTIFNFGPMKLKFGRMGNFRTLITNFNSENQYMYIFISKSAFSYVFMSFLGKVALIKWLPWSLGNVYL